MIEIVGAIEKTVEISEIIVEKAATSFDKFEKSIEVAKPDIVKNVESVKAFWEKLEENTETKTADIETTRKKGGSYGELKSQEGREGKEIHHMPADGISPLDTKDGPAIEMDKDDHRKTASCGNSKDAQEYRKMQKELIEQGKFEDAFQMDVDDIHDKFGDKYDDAIEEAKEYIGKLEQEEKVNG